MHQVQGPLHVYPPERWHWYLWPWPISHGHRRTLWKKLKEPAKNLTMILLLYHTLNDKDNSLFSGLTDSFFSCSSEAKRGMSLWASSQVFASTSLRKRLFAWLSCFFSFPLLVASSKVRDLSRRPSRSSSLSEFCTIKITKHVP